MVLGTGIGLWAWEGVIAGDPTSLARNNIVVYYINVFNDKFLFKGTVDLWSYINA